MQGADGKLYGTTSKNGAQSNGTIFVVSPPFTAGLTPVTIYAFCSAANCTDGGTPLAPLVQGSYTDGNIYGTTSAGAGGGGASPGPNTSGTIFSISPYLGDSTSRFNLLYSFCALPTCTDGATPTGALYPL